MKESELTDWEHFWQQKKDTAGVYPGATDIVAELEKVIDFKDKLVLEVGAGTGRDSFRLADKGGKVVVLDYADNSLAIIKELNAHRRFPCLLVKADAFRLPFKKESFEIVFHQGLLEHFRRPEGILAENRRVLKPEGLLLADVPQRYHPYTVIKHGLILLNRWFAGWETEFSIRQLIKMVTVQNLAVKKTYGSWMYPSLFYRMLREVFIKLKIGTLPLYPKRWPVVGALREKFRRWFKEKGPAFYTFNAIGVIAQKK